MPSFDVVSEADMIEVKNAVEQSNKEITTRFDFKGTSAAVELKDKEITLFGDAQFQLVQVEDVLTGKLKFHQHWQAPCYSGSMNTAGGITFIGHLGTGNAQSSDGYLEAVDTKTGASLWRSPPMDAGVGAAPVTYTVGGKQYVSVAVGGQAHNDVSRPKGLTNPARWRNDSIYTFVLP